MKSLFFVLLFVSSPQSAGSTKLLDFFRDHKIGSTLTGGKEGFNELPELEFSGHKFSAYCDLNENQIIVRIGLYLRQKTSDVSASDLQELYTEMKKMISAESGEAKMFEVPNFEDATERTHEMNGWKNEESIFILQNIKSPDRVEVDVRHVEINHFTSELGADFGNFVLSKLETNAGNLNLPQTTTKNPNQESPKDGPQSESIERENSKEELNPNLLIWAVIIGIAILLGGGLVLIRKVR